jgi:hypothetical protein
MKHIKLFRAFTTTLNEGKSKKLKVDDFVRYEYDGEVTGGKILSIKGNSVEVENWKGSIKNFKLKDLEYEPTWNRLKTVGRPAMK